LAAKDEGKTCIDCHKGIAHHLPKKHRDPEKKNDRFAGIPARRIRQPEHVILYARSCNRRCTDADPHQAAPSHRPARRI
jgi:hypothetical protein